MKYSCLHQCTVCLLEWQRLAIDFSAHTPSGMPESITWIHLIISLSSVMLVCPKSLQLIWCKISATLPPKIHKRICDRVKNAIFVLMFPIIFHNVYFMKTRSNVCCFYFHFISEYISLYFLFIDNEIIVSLYILPKFSITNMIHEVYLVIIKSPISDWLYRGIWFSGLFDQVFLDLTSFLKTLYAITQLSNVGSSQNFAHALTACLSGHVQNFIVILLFQ